MFFLPYVLLQSIVVLYVCMCVFLFSWILNYRLKTLSVSCRDRTEEPMELSEEERNELMKKESSRLLKTGHRVSYSPRKEKALKIYLDGGPSKDPGLDWEWPPYTLITFLFKNSWPARCSVALPHQGPLMALKPTSNPTSPVRDSQRCLLRALRGSCVPGSELLLCTIVSHKILREVQSLFQLKGLSISLR